MQRVKKVKYDIAPGVAEYARYIGTNGAYKAKKKKQKNSKKNPGPIVVVLPKMLSCIGPSRMSFIQVVEK